MQEFDDRSVEAATEIVSFMRACDVTDDDLDAQARGFQIDVRSGGETLQRVTLPLQLSLSGVS